jgi:thiamine biosynthesis lipoprotein
MKRLEFHAMGSRMLAAVDSTSPAAERALESIPGQFEEWEQALSRFRFDSELSRLNRSSGGPVPVSETLWEVFDASLEAEQETGGLVNPTVLDALVQAGYDRSFDLLPTGSSPTEAVALAPASLAAIHREAARHSLLLPEGVHLDFGGLAKGWAARKAAGLLKRFGPALVDAGGDIEISAPPLDDLAWPIGVADPFLPGSICETLRVERGGVATSGIDYHRWQQGGQWNHHIIDPRSGLPAVTDLLTVTIIAPDALRAEVAAKVVLISGSEAGMEWLEADPSLAGLLVLQSGEKYYSRRMPGYLWSES